MASETTLMPNAARKLIHDALTGAGTAPRNAGYLTDAILDTELSGMSGHGFYWLQFYCEHLRSGKVDGRANPAIKRTSAVAYEIDAKGGFAHPAIAAGFAKLIPAAQKHGVAAMGIKNSYNAATLGYHTGVLAKKGLVAFGFTNSSPAMAPVGGKSKVIGTNPMSFAVPGGKGKIAFLIDQSSSAVAWTAVRHAAAMGRAIPLGWALDANGEPTTDPHKALDGGSMAPAGGYKGFGQGLIVEVMCAALAGGNRGLQMGSFTLNDKPIGCGQFFIAIDPAHFSGPKFTKQVKALMQSILSQDGARLPNMRREANQKRLAKEGLPIDRDIYERLLTFHVSR